MASRAIVSAEMTYVVVSLKWIRVGGVGVGVGEVGYGSTNVLDQAGISLLPLSTSSKEFACGVTVAQIRKTELGD